MVHYRQFYSLQSSHFCQNEYWPQIHPFSLCSKKSVMKKRDNYLLSSRLGQILLLRRRGENTLNVNITRNRKFAVLYRRSFLFHFKFTIFRANISRNFAWSFINSRRPLLHVQYPNYSQNL